LHEKSCADIIFGFSMNQLGIDDFGSGLLIPIPITKKNPTFPIPIICFTLRKILILTDRLSDLQVDETGFCWDKLQSKRIRIYEAEIFAFHSNLNLFSYTWSKIRKWNSTFFVIEWCIITTSSTNSSCSKIQSIHFCFSSDFYLISSLLIHRCQKLMKPSHEQLNHL